MSIFFDGSYPSRSSSLGGGDAYAYNALGYASKASQNIHLVTPHGIDSMKVNLQTTDEVEGYNCSDVSRDHLVRVIRSDLSYSQTITPVLIRKGTPPFGGFALSVIGMDTSR